MSNQIDSGSRGLQRPNFSFIKKNKKMEAVNAVKLYDGDGGNAQTEFILDSEVGW